LGAIPSGEAVSKVTYQALLPVLESIARQPVDPTAPVRPVPGRKLESNGLSDSVEALLLAGMKGAPKVERFLKSWHDATFGDAVAAAFRRRYDQLDAAGLTPDRIFVELQVFAGASSDSSSDEQAAILAVLAYLFFSCDIFKEPVKADA
jgi:hypothetical protein